MDILPKDSNMKKIREKIEKKLRENERKTFVSYMKEKKNSFLKVVQFSLYVILPPAFEIRNVLRSVYTHGTNARSATKSVLQFPFFVLLVIQH